MHLGARYYWPEVGRFGQRDPVPTRDSQYGYVNCNPSLHADPSGEFNPWVIAGVIAGLAFMGWQGYECAQAVRWWGKCVDAASSIKREIERDAYASPEGCPSDKDLWQRAWERAWRTERCKNFLHHWERCWVSHVV